MVPPHDHSARCVTCGDLVQVLIPANNRYLQWFSLKVCLMTHGKHKIKNDYSHPLFNAVSLVRCGQKNVAT